MWRPLEIFLILINPLLFLLMASLYLPKTIINLILTRQFRSLVTPSLFKDAWFATFWKVQGPETTKGATPRTAPIIQQAHGIVLEIGAGTGEWLHLYDKSKITKVYGVEPNKDHHELLRERVRKNGLEGVYVVMPVGVEQLGKRGIEKGSVDCVLTVQCLCSVPEPRRIMSEVYGYLKDGGIWLVYEHVVVYGYQGKWIRRYQELIDVVWPHFLGGCSITRDTGKWLKEAGPWSKVDLKQPEDESPYDMVPHVMGVLTK